jgi:hypothetical protein
VGQSARYASITPVKIVRNSMYGILRPTSVDADAIVVVSDKVQEQPWEGYVATVAVGGTR